MDIGPVEMQASLLNKSSKILVTGMSGLIGGLAGRRFAENNDVTALGRSEVEGFSTTVVDIGDGIEGILPAVEGIDTVPLNARNASVWCSHRDILQMIDKAVNATEDLKYAVVFACSDNPTRYRDIEHAKSVLGFVPQDSAADHGF